MMELQHDLKQNLLQSWTELFVLSEHWQSDMKFFRDELNFLNTLIDQYLIKLVEEDNVSKIAPIALALAKLEARSRALDKEIAEHLRHLRELAEGTSHDAQTSRDQHQELENHLIDFVKDFRITKTEVFSAMEHVLKSEKAKHLLKA